MTETGTSRNRIHRVEARFSDDELRRLDDFCEKFGMSRSAALRYVCTRNIIVTHKVRNVDCEKLAEQVRMVGGNVNQIARVAHRLERDWNPRDIAELLPAVKDMSSEFSALRWDVDMLIDEICKRDNSIEWDDVDWSEHGDE